MHRPSYVFLISVVSVLSLNSQHFVLISSPGSGKGTFSQHMVEKHGYIQICPGDIFRREVLQQTTLGKIIAPIIEAGDYVDEEIVCTLMQQYLQNVLDQNKQFILDGFPRSNYSLQFLITFLEEKNILHDVCFLQLQAPDTVCKERMLSRYICNTCSRVYNENMLDQLNSPTCKVCQTKLVFRAGDKELVINKRLLYFHENIEPLLETLQQSIYTVKIINSNQELSLLQKEYNELIN